MQTSDTIAALAEALSKAQAQIEGAVKGRENSHFRNKYADLSSVWDACRAALTDNGLSVVQAPGEIVEGRMALTTRLLHKSGEWIEDRLTIPLAKVDAQAYGSATTYARRYALAAFVGVAPEDDDGNAATAASKAAPQEPKVEPKPPTLKDRADRFAATLNGVGTEDDLRKAYALGSKLCAELDDKDPERLVEINALYERRFIEIAEQKAGA